MLRAREDESGLTTLEWLLIVAAVAGLAALAVVLVTKVVDDTSEQISGSNARHAAARVAAQKIVDDARDEEQPTGKSWAAWEKHYNRKCERVGIIYADAGITVFSMFEASDILHTSNSDFSHALFDRATINPDTLPHTPEIDPWDRLWHGPHPGQANAVCAVSNPSS